MLSQDTIADVILSDKVEEDSGVVEDVPWDRGYGTLVIGRRYCVTPR